MSVADLTASASNSPRPSLLVPPHRSRTTRSVGERSISLERRRRPSTAPRWIPTCWSV